MKISFSLSKNAVNRLQVHMNKCSQWTDEQIMFLMFMKLFELHIVSSVNTVLSSLISLLIISMLIFASNTENQKFLPSSRSWTSDLRMPAIMYSTVLRSTNWAIEGMHRRTSQKFMWTKRTISHLLSQSIPGYTYDIIPKCGWPLHHLRWWATKPTAFWIHISPIQNHTK